MKYLFLILLSGCFAPDKEVIRKVTKPTKMESCKLEVNRYEELLVNIPSTYYNYGICEIDVQFEMCDCYGIKKLPLNCSETLKEIDFSIFKHEKDIKELQQSLSKTKDKDVKGMVNYFIKRAKEKVEQLEVNKRKYKRLCDE